MRKIASLVIALVLVGSVTGCGKSSRSIAPVPSAGGTGGNTTGPKDRTEALQVAEQSGQMAASYVQQVRSLLTVATVPGASGYHTAYHYEGISNVANVAWERSGAPAYPVAGSVTIRWHWTYEYWYGAQHGTGDVVTDATIVFDGTRYAAVTVGGYSFTLDLETETVS